ncbi:hypothetical protein M0802_003094 [Mischocyttarus mexicanus]|nr:hypothetical protein M0802_003094 [Mischocyttarus mexicanus]
MASCSEFAKINNNIENDKERNNDLLSAVNKRKTATTTTMHVRGIKKMSRERFARHVVNKNDNILNNKARLSSLDYSCQQRQQQQQREKEERQQELEEFTRKLRKKNLLKKNVAGVCEFVEKDSVAGMRVANSSRMNSKRNNVRCGRKVEKVHRRPAESMNVKIRRINDVTGMEDEGIEEEDTMNVRTFEKGEIVVSIDGKFLQISPFAQFVHYIENVSKSINQTDENNVKKTIVDTNNKLEKEKMDKKKRNSNDDDDNDDDDEVESTVASLISIEEPDVLECWEAETIEPIRTPKKMLQSQGVSYEGEAVEEDNFQAEEAIVEHVQKYYRFARESATSVEEELLESKINELDLKPFNKSKMVPNSPVELIKGYQGEEIPIIMPNEKDTSIVGKLKMPIDEAFEVYESCFVDKSQSITLDSIFQQRKALNRREGERPVPCRAVCCSIQ